MNKPLKVFIILTIIGLTIYSNSFQGEFCSDDEVIIVNNYAVRNITHLKEIWDSFNTRFLVGLSFALNYRLGELNVSGYHIFNFFSHIVAAYLVYWFVLLTLQTPAIKEKFQYQDTHLIALFSSLVFLCHPIQTQGVAYVTQRAVSMATSFYLATLLFYIKARLDRKPIYYLGGFISMLLGMLTKEMTLTIPLTLVAYEFFFFESWQKDKRGIPKILIGFILISGLLPLILMQDLRGSALELKYKIVSHSFSMHYFLTEINALRTYLRLLFLPFFLRHDYDYPIVQKVFEGPLILSFLLLLTVFIFGVLSFKERRLISFSIIWFFITTSVEAGVVCFAHQGVIYEHWVYLAMVGFSLFLTTGLMALLKDMRRLKFTLTGIIIIFCILTYERNKVWHSCLNLWQDVARYGHKKALPYNNIGIAYSRKGYYFGAIEHYLKALQIQKDLDPEEKATIFVNLGSTYGKLGDFDREIEYSQTAIDYNPKNFVAYSNLGLALIEKGQYDDGIKYSRMALKLNSKYANAYNNIGLAYAKRGNFDQAISLFTEAVHFDSSNKTAKNNLTLAYEKKDEQNKKK